MIEKLRTLFRGELWMAWMIAAMFMQSMQFSTEIEWITNTLLVGYIGCISMFFYYMKKRQDGRMAEVENMSMDFIRGCRKAGQGKFNYFVPRSPDSKMKRLYAWLFKRTYLRVYEALFYDDGMQGFKSYKYVAVSNKQLFEMKLRGMVNTESHEHAEKALKYLGVEWPIP